MLDAARRRGFGVLVVADLTLVMMPTDRPPGRVQATDLVRACARRRAAFTFRGVPARRHVVHTSHGLEVPTLERGDVDGPGIE